MSASTVAIEDPFNNTVDKFYCKIRHNEKDNKYLVESSTKSVATCHKRGRKVH